MAKIPSLMPFPDLLWPAPPALWPLNETHVHIWAAGLDESLERISSLEKTLSPDEQERAARFHFERDRRRFIAGRGILRKILSSYREISPSPLHFCYSSRGKPYLGEEEGRPPFHFNVAHSEDLILIAVTRACVLGIDVERVRPIPERESIVMQYFSSREAAALTALPKQQRLRAFYQLWTCKEACLKATGGGLSDLTDGLEVSFPPGKPAQIRAFSGTLQTAATWTLVELRPAPGYVAALAAPTTGLSLSSWQWSF